MYNQLDKLLRKHNYRAQALKEKKDLMLLRSKFRKKNQKDSIVGETSLQQYNLDGSSMIDHHHNKNNSSRINTLQVIKNVSEHQQSVVGNKEEKQIFQQEHRYILSTCKVFDTDRLRRAFESIDEYKKGKIQKQLRAKTITSSIENYNSKSEMMAEEVDRRLSRLQQKQKKIGKVQYLDQLVPVVSKEQYEGLRNYSVPHRKIKSNNKFIY